jgi:protein tyrosine/serine phosphatase
MADPVRDPAENDDRVLRLAGADNVRDLGGLPTVDGRRTRRGRLFRGELIAPLLEADVEILVAQVGLRSVVDLRTRGEVRHIPGTWLEHGVAWIHCPFRLGEFGPVPGPGADYVAGYLGFLAADPRPVLLAAGTLMKPDSHPALFHCAAGKDRTGVLSALLLDVLGVSRPVIAEDYAMTSHGLAHVLARLADLEPYSRTLKDADAADHEAVAETMIAFLEALDRRHGGAEAWFVAHGLARDAIDRFRAAMLEEPRAGNPVGGPPAADAAGVNPR